ncbi:MAG: glutamine-hydrolyzing carbamoyl-phosphate synthase small subunit [Firmicutes bacterium]|nr:glutamine-hydrolyzing carbamoyl-phosphate synthase small subunit [Bacillota bacterium]
MLTRLALENGKIFYGEGFGATGTSSGEVVFNTSMTGYQEILTDPSYCGQIVTMTYPLIGNYGINLDDFESRRSFVRGFVVKEACAHPNNWRSKGTLAEYLQDNDIIGISGIDTRALTRVIRHFGTLRGIISSDDFSDNELIDKAKMAPDISGQNFVSQVTTPDVFNMAGPGHRVVLLDMGTKFNIAKSLHELGCDVTVVPATTSSQAILDFNPAGLVISNGPGDPKDNPITIATVQELVGKLPMFGICLGHQLLALALGGDTYKLKFGHHGANHPVKDLETTKVQITSQNHGYAVNEEALDKMNITITHRNLNDHTVEGFRHNQHDIVSVQYHPEASPGPTDSTHLFHRFLDAMKN